MRSLSPSQRALHDPNKTMGLTRTERATRMVEHTIYLLNGRPGRLAAVAAHVNTPTPGSSRICPDRALRAGTIGFADGSRSS
jgi:hypothetical protein